MGDQPPPETPPSQAEPTVAGRVRLRIAGEIVEIEVAAPAGPTSLEALLPVFRGLADKAVGIGLARAEARGERLSCQAGCGACCRQAVPIAECEARAIAELVEAMPEPRRAEVRARFAETLQRLEALGLLEQAHAAARGEVDYKEFGVDYFLSGVPCPFLEAEACSIHADRPLICREYLVSSAPEVCAFPVRERLKPIPIPGQPSRALFQVGREHTPGGWVLLAEALDWASGHPASPPAQTGPQLVEAVFGQYAKT